MNDLIETYIVDSFTDEPFKGNPAGVCLLPQPISERLMQDIAKELGLSETAFVYEKEEGQHYLIRYFSPKMEIPLCGHATLAAAKVLFEIHTNNLSVQFTTVEGIDLHIQKVDRGIKMQFPVYLTEECTVSGQLLAALGIDKIERSVYNKETKIILLEIDDNHILRRLTPDFEALKRADTEINGVLVTALSTSENFDFESRYFWPWSGTNEDPVTGGTHTFLAKYWGDQLNKKKMYSYQCSERSGYMEVEVTDDDTLFIYGLAQIVLKGHFMIPAHFKRGADATL